MSACGKKADETTVTNSNTEPAAVTSEAADTEPETATETKTAQPVQDGIFTLNPSSGVFVKEAGNYETYLDDFQFPDQYRIFISCGQVPLNITIGTDKTTDTINLHFPTNDRLDYTVYMTDTDVYSDMSSDSITAESKHAAIENEKDLQSVRNSMDDLNFIHANFTYVDYNGEETIDGIVYDSLACKMLNNDTESDCTFYFTKEGEYVKTTLFCPDTNDTGYIEPISAITMPELTAEETDAKTIAAEYLDLLRNGITTTASETTNPTASSSEDETSESTANETDNASTAETADENNTPAGNDNSSSENGDNGNTGSGDAGNGGANSSNSNETIASTDSNNNTTPDNPDNNTSNNEPAQEETAATQLAAGLIPQGIKATACPTPEDTPEGEILTDTQLFGGYNDDIATKYSLFYAEHFDIISDTDAIYTRYYFDNKEDGQQYNRWCLDAQVNNKSLTMTFEYYVKGGKYRISKIIDHTLTSAN